MLRGTIVSGLISSFLQNIRQRSGTPCSCSRLFLYRFFFIKWLHTQSYCSSERFSKVGKLWKQFILNAELSPSPYQRWRVRDYSRVGALSARLIISFILGYSEPSASTRPEKCTFSCSCILSTKVAKVVHFIKTARHLLIPLVCRKLNICKGFIFRGYRPVLLRLS